MMKKAPPLAPSIWDTNMRPGSNLHIFREDLELTQNFMPQIWMASGSQSGRSWCFGHRFFEHCRATPFLSEFSAQDSLMQSLQCAAKDSCLEMSLANLEQKDLGPLQG